MEPVIKDIVLKSSEGNFRETIAAEQVGEGLFRLLEGPLFTEHFSYGTVVKVECNTKGELEAVEIATLSDYITRMVLLPKELISREKVTVFAQPILDAGGTWETAMGGILLIHLPKNSTFQIESLFLSK